MGSYHGKAGFDTFSHKKSLLVRKSKIDIPIRYLPYRKYKNLFLHFVFEITIFLTFPIEHL